MNKSRRAEIDALNEQIAALIETAETIRDDEQEYLDNIPENLLGSVRYDNAESAVDALDEAIDALTTASEQLEDAKGE